jgi:hypothetical protein
MSGKKVTAQTLTGQQGINLIERRVLEMGCLWYPTGGYEAGIDGHIELLDPTTGEALNLTIRVQSRATRGQFEAETAQAFDYTCTEKDLSYWLSGNAAVILVRSRPDTDEAYWVSLKDYFHDPVTRKSRKIHFDKSRDRFDKSARRALAETGTPVHHGAYFAPPPVEEALYSNILPVTRFGDRLYLGQTTYGSPRDVLEHLARFGNPCGPEWYLKKRSAVLSFHDLAEAHWNAIVDPGTVESFATEEWSRSSDLDRLRDFVALLNRCLQAKLLASEVAYYPPKDYYYFTATKDLAPRAIKYRSLAQNAERTVFLGYPRKNKPGEMGFYRHSALQAQFRRYGGGWFLELSPTYHFTFNGHTPHRWYASKLKGIKALERNPTVLGQVVMWTDILVDGDPGLFSPPPYPFVGFGPVVTFTVGVGIQDDLWLPSEEDEATKDAATETQSLPLFEIEQTSATGDPKDEG